MSEKSFFSAPYDKFLTEVESLAAPRIKASLLRDETIERKVFSELRKHYLPVWLDVKVETVNGLAHVTLFQRLAEDAQAESSHRYRVAVADLRSGLKGLSTSWPGKGFLTLSASKSKNPPEKRKIHAFAHAVDGLYVLQKEVAEAQPNSPQLNRLECLLEERVNAIRKWNAMDGPALPRLVRLAKFPELEKLLSESLQRLRDASEGLPGDHDGEEALAVLTKLGEVLHKQATRLAPVVEGLRKVFGGADSAGLRDAAKKLWEKQEALSSPGRSVPWQTALKGFVEMRHATEGSLHQKLRALIDATLRAGQGRLILVSGPTGAGKSTLIRRVFLDAMDQSLSAIFFDGGILTGTHPADLERHATEECARPLRMGDRLNGCVIFLDGLDRVRANDAELSKGLRKLAQGGAVVVASVQDMYIKHIDRQQLDGLLGPPLAIPSMASGELAQFREDFAEAMRKSYKHYGQVESTLQRKTTFNPSRRKFLPVQLGHLEPLLQILLLESFAGGGENSADWLKQTGEAISAEGMFDAVVQELLARYEKSGAEAGVVREYLQRHAIVSTFQSYVPKGQPFESLLAKQKAWLAERIGSIKGTRASLSSADLSAIQAFVPASTKWGPASPVPGFSVDPIADYFTADGIVSALERRDAEFVKTYFLFKCVEPPSSHGFRGFLLRRKPPAFWDAAIVCIEEVFKAIVDNPPAHAPASGPGERQPMWEVHATEALRPLAHLAFHATEPDYCEQVKRAEVLLARLQKGAGRGNEILQLAIALHTALMRRNSAGIEQAIVAVKKSRPARQKHLQWCLCAGLDWSPPDFYWPDDCNKSAAWITRELKNPDLEWIWGWDVFAARELVDEFGVAGAGAGWAEFKEALGTSPECFPGWARKDFDRLLKVSKTSGRAPHHSK